MIDKDVFLAQCYVMNLKHFYHSALFVNHDILTFASHQQCVCSSSLSQELTHDVKRSGTSGQIHTDSDTNVFVC